MMLYVYQEQEVLHRLGPYPDLLTSSLLLLPESGIGLSLSSLKQDPLYLPFQEDLFQLLIDLAHLIYCCCHFVHYFHHKPLPTKLD